MIKGMIFSFLVKILEKKTTHFQYDFLRSNNYNFILSFKLEDVQSEMTKVSTELEPLENLYELKHNEVIARILNM